MSIPGLREGQLISGALFNEPMRVETVLQGGDGIWTVGLVGTRSERVRVDHTEGN